MPNTKLKELCCYLDTRIVINALGMHLPSEQQAAIELIDMLKTEQAKIYCFEHTVQEIREAIKAYRNDLYYSGRKRKYKTFEQWDEQGYTVERVSRFLTLLENKIKDLNIEIIPTPAKLHTKVKGLYFRTFKEQLDKVPYHSQQAREYDMLNMLSIFIVFCRTDKKRAPNLFLQIGRSRLYQCR